MDFMIILIFTFIIVEVCGSFLRIIDDKCKGIKKRSE